MRDRPSTRREFLKTAAAAASASPFLASSASGDAEADRWDIGPFVKHKEPVLRPTADSRFRCPIRGKEVRWEERSVYNPAAVVRDGKVYLLYRADDRSPDLTWGRTCRIGLAWSENLIDWTPAGRAVWAGSHEAGALALLRKDGILLMVQGGHATLGAWTLRQALIDPKDMTTVLEYQKEPFLYPEYDWEKRGMTADTTVSNGLVPFEDKWFLCYGAADRVIGLATCERG
ncbi:MAG: hypothetical protein JXP34_20050 [Planctomycetes bacterium]|nr:hypothetical protein [Planctomycetota bacterium]